MDEKLIIGLGYSAVIGGVLLGSWYMGIDGVVTTALIGLLGTIIGYSYGASK